MHVTTANSVLLSADAGGPNGSSVLVRGGQSVVTVFEASDLNTGVKFADVCVRRDGSVQGYVQVSTQVAGTNKHSGYHGMRVIATRQPAEPELLRPTRPAAAMNSIAFTSVPGTFRRVDLGGTAVLAADARVEAISSQPIVVRDVPTTESAKGDSVWLKAYTFGNPQHTEVSGTLSGISLSTEDPIAISTTAGRIEADSPPLGLIGVVVFDSLIFAGPDESAAREFIAAAGGDPGAADLTLPLVRVAGARVSVGGVYAHPMGEDEGSTQSEITERLNGALESGDTAVLNRVFGSAQPVNLDVTAVEGSTRTSFSTGTAVTRGGAPVGIRLLSLLPAGRQYRLQMDWPAGTLDNLTVNVQASEVFGASATDSARIYSHVLALDKEAASVDQLIRLVAAAAGAEPQALLRLSHIEEVRPAQTVQETIAQAVRIAATLALGDNIVTLPEFADLLARARGTTSAAGSLPGVGQP